MADHQLFLSDRMIGKLRSADSGQCKVRDAERPGLMLPIGCRTKTFMAQGECWPRAAKLDTNVTAHIAGQTRPVSSRA